MARIRNPFQSTERHLSNFSLKDRLVNVQAIATAIAPATTTTPDQSLGPCSFDRACHNKADASQNLDALFQQLVDLAFRR